MSHPDSESKTKTDVYRDRNLLALAFIKSIKVGHEVSGDEPTAIGWWPDTDDVNDEPWAVVWADTPAGQVGWHIRHEDVPEWLPKRDPGYDGYSTVEKNARLEQLIYDS